MNLEQEFLDCIKDLLESEVVQEMDDYIQHGSTTTLDHCMRVSYKSYRLAKKLGLDYRSAARAGLLHDLFLYDWHKIEENPPLFQKHGFTHPKRALENANKYFELSELEQDIILKHMWPLTLRSIPRYKESVLVSIVDKETSTYETVSPYINKVKCLIENYS